jgi:hypothetical protein
MLATWCRCARKVNNDEQELFGLAILTLAGSAHARIQ